MRKLIGVFAVLSLLAAPVAWPQDRKDEKKKAVAKKAEKKAEKKAAPKKAAEPKQDWGRFSGQAKKDEAERKKAEKAKK